MYKDKDKQREANRQAQARFKAKQAKQGGSATQMIEILGDRAKVSPALFNYVSSQGITDKVLPLKPKTIPVIPKRGLDIKCFADLPPDVQATINRVSESNEEKRKRTQIAIHYQHVFPNRFHSTGIV